MNSSEARKLQVYENVSVKAAMKQMDITGLKILFVVDEDSKTLLGSLTDGDIRRWILREGGLDEKINKIYNRNPIFAEEPYETNEIRKLMLEKMIEWIPVINESKEVAEVLLWKDIFEDEVKPLKRQLNIPVVIMAGGKGTRLDPFTKILPKPLIPIGDKAIIDIILGKFSDYGINEFYLTINHKAKMIKSYFEEVNPEYKITYIEEKNPLGTAGSLRFLKDKIKNLVLVSNCDIIIDCDYCEIVEFHNKNSFDMTIVGSFRHFTIPYGICEIEKNGLLTNITEKPEYDFLVNTGMCILKKNVLELIPEDTVFHITDLAKCIRDNGGKVGVYPINEKSWIDVGQWEEYKKSVKLLGVE